MLNIVIILFIAKKQHCEVCWFEGSINWNLNESLQSFWRRGAMFKGMRSQWELGGDGDLECHQLPARVHSGCRGKKLPSCITRRCLHKDVLKQLVLLTAWDNDINNLRWNKPGKCSNMIFIVLCLKIHNCPPSVWQLSLISRKSWKIIKYNPFTTMILTSNQCH